MKIDIHNHYFPSAYIDDVEANPGVSTVTRTEDGHRHLNYEGDYNIIGEGHVSLEARLKVMDEAGVDMQVLTLTTPGPHVEEAGRGVSIARLVNNQLAEAVAKHPTRFTSMATLPMQDPAASVIELERAVRELGLRGAMVFTNINRKPLWAKEFWPIWEKAAELTFPFLFIRQAPHR